MVCILIRFHPPKAVLAFIEKSDRPSKKLVRLVEVKEYQK